MRSLDLATVPNRHTLTVHHAVDMSYQLSDGTPVKARITFAETATRFGGRRLWLLCPRCYRNCRVIYAGQGRIACRICHGLRYSSQAKSRADRATRAMFKIVRRLDPAQDINDLPPKPKGMHWRTYNRLVDRYEKSDQQWSWEVMRRFGKWL